MGKKIRLKDIAEEIGVSIKTVSRALNDHPDISIETKEKIQRLADKYSYQPNLLAKSLRQKKSYVIGYVLPDITNEFWGDVALAIEKKFRLSGYSLLTSFTNSVPDQEIESLKLLISRQVDGIILATVGTTGEFVKKIINNYKTPIVVIDNKVKGLKTDVVVHDNIKGAYLLTKHLIEHGHKDISCIAGPINETSGKRRLEGYRNALNEYNIKINDNNIEISDWSLKGGYNAAKKLITNSTKKPTAIFSSNSLMAIGALQAFKEVGLKIPEDIALDSFDDIKLANLIDPPLTTLNSVESQIGITAADILINKINGSDSKDPEEVLVDVKLNIRKSCGCK